MTQERAGKITRDDDMYLLLQSSVENSRGSIRVTSDSLLASGMEWIRSILLCCRTWPPLWWRNVPTLLCYTQTQNQRLCDDISEPVLGWGSDSKPLCLETRELAMCRLQTYEKLLGQSGLWGIKCPRRGIFIVVITQPVRRQLVICTSTVLVQEPFEHVLYIHTYNTFNMC